MVRKNASISIGITTFNRPDGCLRLLKDIKRDLDLGGYRARVVVLDDCSTEDYRPVWQFMRAEGWQYTRADKNHGKREWWRLVGQVVKRWSSDAADYFYFLQDDLRLCSDFFSRTIGLWEQMAQPDKASLFLHVDSHRARLGIECWTGWPSRIDGVVEKTQWVDGAGFLCTRALVETLEGAIHTIPGRRWKRASTRSSGVGEQMSRRLHAAKKGMYRALQSYVLHVGDSQSQMNPDRPDIEPMRTVKFIDGALAEEQILREYDYVSCSLASIPSRRGSLQKVVTRLLPQVDHLNVYLNASPAVRGVDEHPDIPKFLRHPKITAVFSQDTEYGDQGDAGKSYWASVVPRGYHVICDDDVLYPPNFVEKLIAGVRRYDHKVVVGFHGAVLTEPFVRYYGSRHTHHFSNRVSSDTPVHIIAGAGGIAYHTSTIRVHRDDFKHPNMGDIWFALLAQQQRVPCICLAHGKGWLVDGTPSPGDSIYAHSKTKKKGSARNTADVQTKVVIENMPWHVRAADGRVLLTVGKAADPADPAPRKRGRRGQRPPPSHKAAFLVAATDRPLLLAYVLRSLQTQVPVPDWGIEILVGGAADDPSRVIAELAGARYVICEGSYPGHKINEMRKATDAELLMLADDDDLQSPHRARGAIEAMVAGALWSSTSGFFCVNQDTKMASWWKGPPKLVGTTLSITATAAAAVEGWPPMPEGKDGQCANHVRRKFHVPCMDLVGVIGETTVTIQHAKNIHQRRPFPRFGISKGCGEFTVTGKGSASEISLPDSLAPILKGVVS